MANDKKDWLTIITDAQAEFDDRRAFEDLLEAASAILSDELKMALAREVVRRSKK